MPSTPAGKDGPEPGVLEYYASDELVNELIRRHPIAFSVFHLGREAKGDDDCNFKVRWRPSDPVKTWSAIKVGMCIYLSQLTEKEQLRILAWEIEQRENYQKEHGEGDEWKQGQ